MERRESNLRPNTRIRRELGQIRWSLRKLTSLGGPDAAPARVRAVATQMRREGFIASVGLERAVPSGQLLVLVIHATGVNVCAAANSPTSTAYSARWERVPSLNVLSHCTGQIQSG
jgi:hypothetical protein